MVRALRAAQARHDERIEKLDKARKQVQKHEDALRELESEISELERSFYVPRIADHGQSTDAKTKLRPARLIYNPKAAQNDSHASLENILNALRVHGIDAQVTTKTSGKVVREAARQAAQENQELVIVAGGDGTIEKVAAQLVGSDTTLAILPTGTNNNLARALGVPLDLSDACALIGMGVTRKIDIGRVNAGAKPHQEYFLETAGIGLNAIAFPLGQDAQKGRWSGLPRAVRKLFEFKPEPIVIELDDGQIIQAHSQVVTVSNAPLTGMNFLIAPDAKMDDGWLDVAVFDEMSKPDLLGYLVSARNAQRVTNPKVKSYRARRVRIRPSQPEPVVSDKDALPEQMDLDIEIVPQGLKVVVGKGMGLMFPVEVALSVPPPAGTQQSNGHDKNPELDLTNSNADQPQLEHA